MATAQARPAVGAEQGGEQEQRGGGQRGLERHPEAEGGPVGHEGDAPDRQRRWPRGTRSAAGPGPRRPGTGATRCSRSARAALEVFAGGQPDRGGRPVARPADHQAGADAMTPAERPSGHATAPQQDGQPVGGDGVGQQRADPAAPREEAAHPEHGGHGDGDERDLAAHRRAVVIGLALSRLVAPMTRRCEAAPSACVVLARGSLTIDGPRSAIGHRRPTARRRSRSWRTARSPVMRSTDGSRAGADGRRRLPRRAVEVHDRDRAVPRPQRADGPQVLGGDPGDDRHQRAAARPTAQQLRRCGPGSRRAAAARTARCSMIASTCSVPGREVGVGPAGGDEADEVLPSGGSRDDAGRRRHGQLDRLALVRGGRTSSSTVVRPCHGSSSWRTSSSSVRAEEGQWTRRRSSPTDVGPQRVELLAGAAERVELAHPGLRVVARACRAAARCRRRGGAR